MSPGCAPGKACCDDCKKGDAPITERFLVQAGRDFAAGSAFKFLEQGTDIVTWGPASTEAISEDAKLVRMTAIEAALPATFDVGTATFLHKDQNLARLEPRLNLDPSRVPAGPARDLAAYLMRTYGGAPTAVLPVTTELVQAFPKQLAPHLGKKAFFAGVRIKGATETQRFIQNEIRQGRLDSYSISGMPTESEERVVCEGNECKTVQEITRLDLSAVTLGANREKAGPLSAKVRNPGAAFLLLQQARPETSKSHTHAVAVVDAATATSASTAVVEQAKPAATEPTPPAAPAPVEQAKPDDKAPAPLPPAAAKPVEQGALDPSPAPTQAPQDVPAGQEPEAAKAKDVYEDLLRRLEAIEQRLATPAATPPAPTSNPEPVPDAPVGIEEAKKYMEQAAKTIEQAAVKAATDAFAKLLQQARPADTPMPASPADPAKTRQAALLEAARTGDPVKLLEALGTLPKASRE